jgi:hypothetical protein
MSLSQPRETGTEKSGLTCPRCATELPAITSTYGSVVSGACPVCWPEQAPTQLAAQKAAAQEPVSPKVQKPEDSEPE